MHVREGCESFVLGSLRCGIVKSALLLVYEHFKLVFGPSARRLVLLAVEVLIVSVGIAVDHFPVLLYLVARHLQPCVSIALPL